MPPTNGSFLWGAVTAFAAAHEDAVTAVSQLLWGGAFDGAKPGAGNKDQATVDGRVDGVVDVAVEGDEVLTQPAKQEEDHCPDPIWVEIRRIYEITMKVWVDISLMDYSTSWYFLAAVALN